MSLDLDRCWAARRSCDRDADGRFVDGVRSTDTFGGPSCPKQGGARETVWFHVAPCSLGRVLVAWTERGVCRVDLGDDDVALRRALTVALPRAQRIAAPAPAHLAAVLAGIDEGRAVDLPLDLRGTAFQERVWQALRDIPPGQRWSYAELAAAVGSGARAVAGACAANVVAVAVPCHRVVRSDGSLSGYRWGVERKRALLRHEADRARGAGPEHPT